ncbi:ATP-binding protein [Streptomyces sp. NPDC000410]|uniref:ATP-binding protein n=1 Tax=Streptomyces sp. NPDC000410 TaxID=3154254 RepID=UPI00333351A6
MPLTRQQRFPRSRRSVPAARDFVGATVTEWGFGGREYDIRLCVSELATNALLHGVPPGREMCVALSVLSDVMRIEVRDSGDGDPEIRHVPAGECTGRGLWVVREIADDFCVREHVVGKTVWASFKVDQQPGAWPGRAGR